MMMMVVLFECQCLIASKTRTREVASSAKVASSLQQKSAIVVAGGGGMTH